MKYDIAHKHLTTHAEGVSRHPEGTDDRDAIVS
jgi:hypothetical protein